MTAELPDNLKPPGRPPEPGESLADYWALFKLDPAMFHPGTMAEGDSILTFIESHKRDPDS